MAKTVTLRVDDDVYKIFSSCAKAEKRSLSNYIEVATLEYAKESAFVDDLEMEKIISNKNLVKRLKRGSQQAKSLKGRFVDSL